MSARAKPLASAKRHVAAGHTAFTKAVCDFVDMYDDASGVALAAMLAEAEYERSGYSSDYARRLLRLLKEFYQRRAESVGYGSTIDMSYDNVDCESLNAFADIALVERASIELARCATELKKSVDVIDMVTGKVTPAKKGKAA